MLIDFEIGGLKNLEKNLKQLGKKAEAIGGKNHISLKELFPLGFMKYYTDFENIEELLDKSGFKIESEEDLANIPNEEWDKFINKHTQFSNWQEMLEAALNKWTKRKLKL